MSGLRVYGPLGRMARRLAAVVLVGQALAVFFAALVARALAALDVGSPEWQLWAGVGLAVACVLASGLLRMPFGVTVGWVLQVLTLAYAVVVPMMLVVGAVFLALWLMALLQGARMDAHAARVDAQWRADHPQG
ncbi:MAG TPA: DUF4233 domain-containing protein [Dermatophilaceae bacterium]|nr:DUF4233 domain-containing protein [Dermatophilaceae bacterium]